MPFVYLILLPAGRWYWGSVVSVVTSVILLINCTLGSTMPHHKLFIILFCLSTHLSSLPIRTSDHCLTRPQPCLTSTQTYIHLNKLPSAYKTSTARSRHSPTHLSLLTATLLLCGDIHPIQVPPTLQTSSSAPSILALCSPPNMLTHSKTLPTTTKLTSSHLLKHGFVAPQHLPS